MWSSCICDTGILQNGRLLGGHSRRRDWKLSVWIVGQKRCGLDGQVSGNRTRSPVGQFDDIFFRFDTPYRG